jgi:predicted  nucleic acid-binding Zn-ribbon protein
MSKRTKELIRRVDELKKKLLRLQEKFDRIDKKVSGTSDVLSQAETKIKQLQAARDELIVNGKNTSSISKKIETTQREFDELSEYLKIFKEKWAVDRPKFVALIAATKAEFAEAVRALEAEKIARYPIKFS